MKNNNITGLKKFLKKTLKAGLPFSFPGINNEIFHKKSKKSQQ